MHPLLPLSTVDDLARKAAVALDRHGHEPSALIYLTIDGLRSVSTLEWEPVDTPGGDLMDRKRVTEDAAEAISLALVSTLYAWVVRRRLQQGEHADWLLDDTRERDDSLDRKVALEVSGTDGRDDSRRRIREKTEQIRKCRIGRKVVCVVEFGPPRANLVNAGP